MAGRLTDRGLERAARVLDVEVAALRAVVAVESAGQGFLPDGRPKILFESHIFSRRTGARFDRSHPELSTPMPARQFYARDQYLRLYQAVQLDADAAIQSCSWGLFQIMGFNYQACGEASLHGFVLAMNHNEDAHLNLAANLIAERGWDRPLRRRQWDEFARQYNGPAFKENRYDEKLAAAYQRYAQGGA
ncbi:N-acetylmuramidase family protein [Marilutibacter aestuarii]|uniref:N-acetylmuramidase family protein n=1 Tax=Marilutibacter aestuarii TaxID=1706195 RepID=A0A508ARY3_9GAMM|nr:N-acetylmuramidase family protein [Lysobacter aestuarii]TQD51231.1 N-acetylmuramidase family protein [Lysobacter aestuarii]